MSRRSDQSSPAARRAVAAFQIFLVLATLLAPIPVMAEDPSAAPSEPPATQPAATPDSTLAPTEEPTAAPTEEPTPALTDPPTAAPTEAPTTAATEPPTSAPTDPPTSAPTFAPTDEPTAALTDEPTAAPTEEPTTAPTTAPEPATEPSSTPSVPVSAPSIKSDLEDYPPGGLVTLTGANWQPGESVHIFVNDDFGSSWSRNVDVIADASGNITDQFNLPNWFVAVYSVVASGPTGTARATFTDASLNVTRGPTGSPPNITFNFTYQRGFATNACVTGDTTASATVSSDAGVNLTGLGSGAFVKITVPNNPTSPAGYTFNGWTAEGDAPALGAQSSQLSICVRNTQGSNSDRYRANYVVANSAPAAVNDAYSVNEDGTLTIVAPGVLGNDTDSDSNPLTVATPRPASGPAHGSLTLNANGSFTYTPDANFNGTDSFTYRANDGTANSAAPATVNITVNPVNDAPSLTGIPNISFDEDGSDTSIDLDTYFSDLETSDANATFTVQGTHPGVGVSINASTHIVTVTGNANFNGSVNVTLRGTDRGDPDGCSSAPCSAALFAEDTFQVTLNPVNDAPTATDDDYTTSEDANISRPDASGVRANDSDHETGTSDLEVDLVSLPSHALSFTLHADGSFSYTPAANYFGTDTFTYTVTDDGDPDGCTVAPCDAEETSVVATVTITILAVNDAPTAVDDDASTDEDNAVVIDVVFNDTDVEDDSLSVKTGSITSPSHGTATLITSGLDAGKIEYTPEPDYNGPDTFEYEICDDGESQSVVAGVPTSAADPKCSTASADVDVTVNPVNDAPTATDGTASMDEDAAAILIDLRPLADDVETADGNLTYTIVSGPAAAAGTLSSTATTGAFGFDSADNFNGPASFTFTVTDRGDPDNCGAVVVPSCTAAKTSTTQTVNITVNPVNDAPELGAIGNKTGVEGTAVGFTATATDIENDTLTYSLADGATGCSSSVICVVPSGASINSSSGVFSWLPPDNGASRFKVVVTDDGDPNLADSEEITITVGNANPAISGLGVTVNSVTGLATATFDYSDAGWLDTHSATFGWSVDGSTTPGVVTPTPGTAASPGPVRGSVLGTRTLAPGCHTLNVTATITDDDTGSGQAATTATSVDVFVASFQAPIKDNERNIARYGNVVPVKVILASSCQPGMTNTSAVLHVTIVQGNITGDIPDGTPTVVAESVSNADTGTQMRVADGRYIYNLSTGKMVKGKDYTILIRAVSPTGTIIARALFQPK